MERASRHAWENRGSRVREGWKKREREIETGSRPSSLPFCSGICQTRETSIEPTVTIRARLSIPSLVHISPTFEWSKRE